MEWLPSLQEWEGGRRLVQKAAVRLGEGIFTPHWGWARNHPNRYATNSQVGEQGSLVILYLTQMGNEKSVNWFHKASFKHRVEITHTHSLAAEWTFSFYGQVIGCRSFQRKHPHHIICGSMNPQPFYFVFSEQLLSWRLSLLTVCLLTWVMRQFAWTRMTWYQFNSIMN